MGDPVCPSIFLVYTFIMDIFSSTCSLGKHVGCKFFSRIISLSIVCGWVAQKVILSILIAPGSKGNAGNFRLCNFETKY